MLVRRTMAALVLAAGLIPAAGSALPGSTPIKCVLTDPQTTCGYFAAGPGRYDISRVGPWVVRVYRQTVLVWAMGGQGPDSLGIPSLPGDRVEAAIIQGSFCPAPPDGVPAPRCRGAGVIVLSEGLPGPL